ncbi:LPS-assembly protein LptD [Hyphomonas sp.]|uniref:LPS-assembly protein LptD n=1 Tax=Hyphomonas sp. TaxID=87 RepID=UPI00391D5FD9
MKWSYFALTASLALGAPLTAAAQAETRAPAEAVILEADQVYELRDENSIVAEGNVEALYEGRILRADRLVYNRTTERVRATGNVVIIEADGTQMFAREVEVGANLSDGYVIGYSARLADNATVTANSAIRTGEGVNALEQVVYTACEACADKPTPTWAIRARRAVQDEESQMIHYRDAVFEVGGIPVFYLPYLAHPDPNSDRRSGLLIPDAGISSKIGAYYQQPYHWVVSDYSDITIAPMLSEKVNPLIGLDFRKRFYSGEVKFETSFTHEADFDSDGEKFGEEKFRGHIYGQGAFAITDQWKWGFGVEHQSDDLYDRRYDISGQTDRRGLYTGQPRRLLSQLYTVGQGDSYYADLSVLSFQGLRATDSSSQLPLVAPLAYAEKYWDFGDLGFASVNASSASLTRDGGADSQRVSVGADWQTIRILPGGFAFEPFAEMRGDYYALDPVFSGKDQVTRFLGNAGAKLSYPMVRPGKAVDVFLEPTVMAAWGVANANDPAIPVEDSQFYEFDESSLFYANGFGNFDLYEGDGKASAGLTARAVWKNGVELASTVGRRWRSEADPAFDRASNLDGKSSDWVGTASLNFGQSLRLSSRVRLDPDDLNLNRLDARISTTLGRFRAVGQYYKIDGRISPTGGLPDEGVYLRSEFNVTDRYSVIFGQLRDITRDLNPLQEFGLAYSDDCARFELVYRRTEQRDRSIGPSENIQFRFTLRSLGNFGSGD